MEIFMKKLCITITIILLSIILTGCLATPTSTNPPELLEPVSVNIDTATVKKDDIYETAVYNAEVIPYTLDLSFQISGNISEVHVTLGESVKKGQILATLDESDLLDEVKSLEEIKDSMLKTNQFANTLLEYDLDILKIELKQLNEKLDITTDEAEKKNLKLSIDIKTADIKIAELKLKQAKELQEYELNNINQSLKERKEKTGQNKILAPFDGSIAYIGDQNKFIPAESTFITITDPSKQMLKSDYVSDSELRLCHKYYALIHGKEYSLENIPTDFEEYYKIVLAGGTPTTKFNVTNADAAVQFGDFASVCVVGNYVKDTLVIPIDSIYSDNNSKYVYIMNGNSRVKKDVTVGISTNSLAEITGGLKEGDTVYVKN
jgi:HlyD family secretion protein